MKLQRYELKIFMAKNLEGDMVKSEDVEELETKYQELKELTGEIIDCFRGLSVTDFVTLEAKFKDFKHPTRKTK